MKQTWILTCFSLIVVWSAAAQSYDPAPLIAAQKEAMKALARMDGIWEGTAWTMMPDGSRHELRQTERIGTMLDGTVRVIEGRGYEPDGSLSFNAFGVVSFDPRAGTYSMRSHAQGSAGDFPMRPTDNGFEWTIEVGPMKMDYRATMTDSTWHEVGYRSLQGGEPVQFFEMTLTRTGSTDWPAAGAITPSNNQP